MAVAAALALTLFLFNALLMLYARSVIQHAADVGARAGAREGTRTGIATCEERAARTIADLANLYASSAPVKCERVPLDTDAEITADAITTATIKAQLEPVFPAFGPDWSFTIRAASITEPVS